MIHSFSAADLSDRQSLAGRWLAQGAFVFFGSVYEPFLIAFRPPRLVADLIEAGAPLVAGLRQGESEPFGFPWRLVYLGDPLYRPWVPRERPEPLGSNDRPGSPPSGARLSTADWQELALQYARWRVTPVDVGDARQSSSLGPLTVDSDQDRLRWCLDAVIVHLTVPLTQNHSALKEKASESKTGEYRTVAWLSELRAVRRERLLPRLRPIYDDLLIDGLEEIGALAELQARLAEIPSDECGPRVWMAMERCAVGRLAQFAGTGSSSDSFAGALDLWDEVIRLPWPKGCEFPAQFTERVAALIAVDPSRRREPWLARLSRAADALPAEPGRFPHAAVVEAERRRIESQIRGRAKLTKESR
jgi:hypothetical protein